MSNNRLYLVDEESGEHILLAKSYSEWFQYPTEENLNAWFVGKDVGAAVSGRKGSLRLLYEDEFFEWQRTAKIAK